MRSRRKHITLNLDEALLCEALAELGTTQVTETIHRALEEVAFRARREAVLAYDFPGLTPESVEEMREGRPPGPSTGTDLVR